MLACAIQLVNMLAVLSFENDLKRNENPIQRTWCCFFKKRTKQMSHGFIFTCKSSTLILEHVKIQVLLVIIYLNFTI